MEFVFCRHPFEAGSVEPLFEAEAVACAGGSVTFDFDRFCEGDVVAAMSRLPRREPSTSAIYRGWMMGAETYRLLHQSLSDRGYELITSPQAYERCHHFSGWCDAVSEWSAPFTRLDPNALSEATLASALAPLKDGVVVLKDEVKSVTGIDRIDDPSDTAAAAEVVQRFLQACDGRPTGNLVFRRMLDFKRNGDRVAEVRSFLREGVVIPSAPRGDYDIGRPPEDWLSAVAARIDSPFFTVDAGLTESGEWMVIEVGDGQVSELPSKADAKAFVENLRRTSA